MLRRSLLSLLVLTAACGGTSDQRTPGSGPTAPPISPAPVAPGLLTIASFGLPEGASPSLSVTGPLPGATFSRTATGPLTWTDVPAGRYAVTVAAVRTSLGTFRPAPATFDVDVPAGGPPALVTATYRAAPSTISVTLEGLPAGTAADLSVIAPTGAITPLPAGGTLTTEQLPAGNMTSDRWGLRAGPVTSGGARYTPQRTALDTVVAFGDTARVPLRYELTTGAIAVALTGLPAQLPSSNAPVVQLAGPGNDTRTVTGTQTLTGLAPGRWRVLAPAFSWQGITWRPALDSFDVDVSASLVAAPATIVYAAQVGRLSLALGGLPPDVAAALTLTSAIGTARPLTMAGLTDSLPAGTYTLTALPVIANGDRYAPAPATQTVSIATGATSTAAVSYTLASGTLALTVTGLPSALAADVRVTGPNGFARTVTASQQLNGLEPGRYTVGPRAVRTTDAAYGVPGGPLTLDVAASATAAAATVQYTLLPTVVDVPVTGLPNGVPAAIVLTDPENVVTSVTASYRATPARSGRWRLSASPVSTGTASYAPTPTARDTVVSAGDTLHFGVAYRLTTGQLALAVSGLPGGSHAAVTVTGPAGYTRTVTASTTLAPLVPGSYTVTAASVSSGGATYQAAPTSQTVTVSASPQPAAATVTYSLPAGSVAVSVSGLPAGATPTFTLTGPGPTRVLNGAGTVSGLAVGTWSISAANTTASGTTYTPSPAVTSATVVANGTTPVSFTYSSGGGGGTGAVNYTVSHVHLTQAIQRLDGTVALVANRDALLRVFVTASAANSARPDVRVRLFDGATLLQTYTLSAPEMSVRTALAEGTLGSTWNLPVPASQVRTTLRVAVELDPTQAIADADRSDNVWPAGGGTRAITVNAVPTFAVRFVPVIVGALTGNVNAANQEQFLTSTRRLLPVQQISADVRAPFTSSATVLQSDDANGQWLTVLSEMNALRATDGAPATTHYYGVVKTSYTSGVAGYGYVPGRAAIGWDHLPSGGNVAAHEWGHNFGRSHAPCGTSGDGNYPYGGGVIGQVGWNSGTGALVQATATDFMGYCANTWTSDYTWSGIMQYRAGSGLVSAAAVSGIASRDGLLVWGRVVNGRIELEPAFRVSAPPTPVSRGATHRLELLDDAGSDLLSLPLEAPLVDHVTGREERQFAVVVPWSAALEQRLARVRVRDLRIPTRVSEQRARALAPPASGGGARLLADPDPGATLERSAGQVRVRWQNSAYPMAMVRDASTGQLMGFVRRPGSAVLTGGRAVDVVFSDGVRSAVRR